MPNHNSRKRKPLHWQQKYRTARKPIKRAYPDAFAQIIDIDISNEEAKEFINDWIVKHCFEAMELNDVDNSTIDFFSGDDVIEKFRLTRKQAVGQALVEKAFNDYLATLEHIGTDLEQTEVYAVFS